MSFSDIFAILGAGVFLFGIVAVLIIGFLCASDEDEWKHYLEHPEEYDDFFLPANMTNEQYVKRFKQSSERCRKAEEKYRKARAGK